MQRIHCHARCKLADLFDLFAACHFGVNLRKCCVRKKCHIRFWVRCHSTAAVPSVLVGFATHSDWDVLAYDTGGALIGGTHLRAVQRRGTQARPTRTG
jgi:hypothetical protein